MKKTQLLFAGLILLLFMLPTKSHAQTIPIDSLESKESSLLNTDYQDELNEILMRMPNVTIGKGISFQPQNKSFKLTMRIRMQNMVNIGFDQSFKAQDIEAQVKRLRLRFDGYIYSPKLTYSVQLGFTPYDTRALPNGNTNIVRDAMVYFVPNSTWNIGFGQTKLRTTRARINSSSALQFVDRSIVNSEFNIDRDFGFFGEFNQRLFKNFELAAKASVTTGEGRNWGNSKGTGLSYTGRLELFPLGRFKAKGDVMEGDYEREETPKILLAGAYNYNDRAMRVQGSNGSLLQNDQRRNLSTYWVDFIFKYQGFSFNADWMGRLTSGSPLIQSADGTVGQYILAGSGINVQTSYIFPKDWEIALRNSIILPDTEVQPYTNYRYYNQSTLGVTKYIIDHRLKAQIDLSYNHKEQFTPSSYNRWQVRFQVELGF